MFSLNSSNKSSSSSSSNSDYSNDTKKAITHLFLHPFLPYDKKDDEKFKILLCKTLQTLPSALKMKSRFLTMV